MNAPDLSSCNSKPEAGRFPPYLYLAGVGSVGKALLRQLGALSERETRFRLLGACTSRRAVWANEPLAPDAVPERLSTGASTDWAEILSRLERPAPHPLVFVDATGSLEVAGYYERLLRAGVHIVTPSKHAFTQEQAYFDRLKAAAREGGARYRYETTVGAGLPVVQTVQSLLATGDEIREIRGAVSGTLTFLLSEMQRGRAFSEALHEASKRGYTEPDVRDDLSGEDVVRKFIILARTAGFRLERTDVHVEPLLPEGLRGLSWEAFAERLSSFDEYWRERVQEARARSRVLCYAGTLADGRVQVGVEAVPIDSPLGQLHGADNLFEIYTKRYDESPLIIRGPGAGPEVTAAGVLSDCLRVEQTVTNGLSKKVPAPVPS